LRRSKVAIGVSLLDPGASRTSALGQGTAIEKRNF
jgi:hypothetical protein